MSLNIKNQKAHALAVQLAQITGESLTGAVTQALRERLERLQQPDTLADELLAIGRDCALHLKEPYRTTPHGELLYDDKGLPK